jgi:hypothetical protein
MIRTLDEDGTLHFNHLKKIALSGVQYLHAVNNPTEPTRAMLIGTAVHQMTLGLRAKAKPIVQYDGRRAGEKWEKFESENQDKEILNASEWEAARQIAASLMRSPRTRARLEGARTEVPLYWEEGDFKCSTDGVDIFATGDGLGELKTVRTTNPDMFKVQSLRMHYAHQLVWYRRGARANGRRVNDLFILGVEQTAPFEVVELVVSSELAELAERQVQSWLEKLRGYMLSIPEPQTIYDWPGYAVAPVVWDPPAWLGEDVEEDEEDAA